MSGYNRVTSTGSATLSYDPVGRLYETAGGATTRFAYDGLDLIGEYNASGTLLRRYVHGPSFDEPLVWYEGSGTTDRRWLMSDQLGSVTAVTNASGAVTDVNTYDEYGTPGSANAGRFQYTGQAWIGEAQLYHYKARAYAPALGRFLQTDPILWGGGMNLYAYVGNDPVNWVDPLGLQTMDCANSAAPCRMPPITIVGCSPRADGCITDAFEIRNYLAGLSPTPLHGPPQNIDPPVGGGAVEEEIVVTGRRPPRFVPIEEDGVLPLFPLPGEPGNICGHAYFECLDVIEREQYFRDNSGRVYNSPPPRSFVCRAAASMCVADARRLYQSPNQFDYTRREFPYGTGEVIIRIYPGGYEERYVPGPAVPADRER